MSSTTTVSVRDLGRMEYRPAWELQEKAHASVLAGGAETIFIVEHPPVITLGRRDDSIQNLVTTPGQLQQQGVELVHSDRGGDITYHGPGQFVAYPIIRLASHGLSVSGYVHKLESILIDTLAEFGIAAKTDPTAVGVWTMDGPALAKIGAIGVRIKRGVSLHGLALNVSTDLSGFNHIIPCGLAGRPVTSIRKILGEKSPDDAEVKQTLISHLLAALTM